MRTLRKMRRDRMYDQSIVEYVNVYKIRTDHVRDANMIDACHSSHAQCII